MKPISFLLIIVFFLSSCSNIISQPTLILSSSEVMYISGAITNNQENQMRNEASNLKYLVLQSYGGQLNSALVIARLVRENNIITVIPKDGYCSSACTVIFQAGVERYAGKNSTLLYHGARVGRTVMDDYYQECTTDNWRCLVWYEFMRAKTLDASEKLFDALLRYGIDPSFVNRYMNWKKDPNWTETGNFLGIADLEISAAESMKYNITTKIINYKFQ